MNNDLLMGQSGASLFNRPGFGQLSTGQKFSDKTDDAFNYNDLNALNELKLQGKKDEDAALKNVARQFESMFINMVMKSVREANQSIKEDGLFSSEDTKFYEQMHDEQMALNLSKGNGIGLAEVLYEQMSQHNQYKKADTSNINVKDMSQMDNPILNTLAKRSDPSIETNQSDLTSSEGIKTSEQKSTRFSQPLEFVKNIWPIAKDIAQELNLNPKHLIAQAALETGWGRHIMNNNNGDNSFNLFGIKANNSWQGEHSDQQTLEFYSGSPQTINDKFRVYENYEHSFKDYVNFLSSNERYADALKAANTDRYPQALQQAGYATDPNYGQKISKIADGTMLAELLKSVDS